jgi:hypothetical protein
MGEIMEKKVDFSVIAKFFPLGYLTREEAERITGGLVSAKYLANLDADGKGPAGKIHVGRKAAYPVESFIEWLESRST